MEGRGLTVSMMTMRIIRNGTVQKTLSSRTCHTQVDTLPQHRIGILLATAVAVTLEQHSWRQPGRNPNKPRGAS